MWRVLRFIYVVVKDPLKYIETFPLPEKYTFLVEGVRRPFTWMNEQTPIKADSENSTDYVQVVGQSRSSTFG